MTSIIRSDSEKPHHIGWHPYSGVTEGCKKQVRWCRKVHGLLRAVKIKYCSAAHTLQPRQQTLTEMWWEQVPVVQPMQQTERNWNNCCTERKKILPTKRKVKTPAGGHGAGAGALCQADELSVPSPRTGRWLHARCCNCAAAKWQETMSPDCWLAGRPANAQWPDHLVQLCFPLKNLITAWKTWSGNQLK